MCPDEINIVVELDDVLVTVDDPITVETEIEMDVDLKVVVAGNMGPPGPKGDPDTSLSDHIISESPHPVYDDGPSLDILYQNAKV